MDCEPRPGTDWRRVAALVFAIAWGGNEFTPLLVMYRDVSHYSALMVNVLLGAYVLGIIPALLIGGPLSDRYGRRRLLIPAAPIGIIGSLILAAGPSSVAMLSLGRVLSGVALGLAMAVGTTWITELSAPGTGARRASLALTLGFLVGAGIAGALAQWGPWRTALPYLLHAAVTALTWLAILPARETHPRSATPRRLRDDLRVPALGHRRFWRVVVPLAPWVFGAVGSAYAVLPGLMRDHSGGMPIAFSALLTVITLACGFGIQSLGRTIDTRHSARASVVALVMIVAGLSLAAWAAATLSLPVVIVAAAVLGCGYGIALVAGLSEVQRIAGPDDLAGLTAVYYSIAYTGFFVPALLSLLSGRWAYPVMFGGGVVLAVVALVVVACAWRAHLPTGGGAGHTDSLADADAGEAALVR
ncbi:MFS transporter [Cellulomonas denverensis]|uniref:MFS transporter n=1 Tax=Cellulomonas denverensis TaxID=264297 RepID=A0A7X6QYJ5_9CELL|nr:MFS transporter [Cellulomonas denverensis]NKY22061.1 MFS transporter [Cellulomonas denverensis]GIG27387.1 major facilitator family transporter [Cellulomonas denverensis]